MKTRLFPLFLLILFSGSSCLKTGTQLNDFWNYASSRKSDLRLSVYVTAHTVNKLFATEAGRREVVSLLRCNGISGVYLEVYRSGLVIPPDKMRSYVSFLEENGFEVVGGIATVPGADFGVQQQGPLAWFNWQNPKTQDDLRKVMEDSAPLFDTFIIDDFLCTADTSLESKAAKGDRDWSEYRRSLLTELSEKLFINPAKEKNPSIKMIIKYPQWYDRFHLFGYDVASQPGLFDNVWVGTETRGQYTQRYGFVQPYEGFINYRWISTLAGEKIGGAWFDHGDCTDIDFIEQAYQSVLAGSQELVIFSFDSFVTGHPGHHLLRQDYEKLADLANAIKEHPVVGAAGYKPPNSDAKGDLYLLDYIGMMGISLVPVSDYPEASDVIFLPTQAASDSGIVGKISKSLNIGAKIIMTTGFIANSRERVQLEELAGIRLSRPLLPFTSQTVFSEGKLDSLKISIVMDYNVVPENAEILLRTGSSSDIPFLVVNKTGNIYVLNSHTFSREDFDAVGEVLLCPGQLGLLELPLQWINTIRSAFRAEDEPIIEAPSRVSYQRLSDGSFVIHNYNAGKATVEIMLKQPAELLDFFSKEPIQVSGNEIRLEMNPRERIWIKKTKK